MMNLYENILHNRRQLSERSHEFVYKFYKLYTTYNSLEQKYNVSQYG